jgi:hypothetical protein
MFPLFTDAEPCAPGDSLRLCSFHPLHGDFMGAEGTIRPPTAPENS